MSQGVALAAAAVGVALAAGLAWIPAVGHMWAQEGCSMAEGDINSVVVVVVLVAVAGLDTSPCVL